MVAEDHQPSASLHKVPDRVALEVLEDLDALYMVLKLGHVQGSLTLLARRRRRGIRRGRRGGARALSGGGPGATPPNPTYRSPDTAVARGGPDIVLQRWVRPRA